MKLKRKFAIGLCLFYVLSVTGMALSMHFCSGDLADVAFFQNETSCTMCNDIPLEKKTDNCCEDTEVIAKVDHSHQLTSTLTMPDLFLVDHILPYPALNLTQRVVENTTNDFLNRPPPTQSKVAILVLHQTFRI